MLKTLIVDDDAQNRYMLEVLLQGNGYRVVLAANGTEALDMARREPPDLIISDILMPVMDGFALCREWKTDAQLSDIPFIFYTATYTDPHDEELALSLGAERFIVKPMEPDKFVKILREVMAERQTGTLTARREPPPEETVYYKKYNAVLVRKLEDKLFQLEETNRTLTREIEERKRAEQTLRDSEAGFRLLFANNPNPMWVYDLETLQFLEVNKAAITHYGYSREEFLQMRIVDIRPPEDVPLLLEQVKQIRVELEISGEWRHQLKNGGIIEVAIVSHTLDFAGRKAALVVARDITRRKQAEAALRHSEDRFRRLAENAPDLIYRYRLRPAPGFEYVSPATAAITGYSPEEHYADPQLGFKLVHPDDRPLIEQLAAGEISPEPLVLRWVRKDGRVIWTEQRNVPVYDEAGHLMAIEGIARDITERKQAETALRHSEERFRATFEQAAVGISHTAPDGRWLRVNQKLCDVVGYTREELLQRKFQDITHPDDLETDLGYAHRVLAGEIATYSIEKRFFRRDGSLIWVDLTVSLVCDVAGEPDYFVSVVQDISQRKQVEEEIRRRNRELALLNQVIAASAAGADQATILETVCRELALVLELPQTAAALLNDKKDLVEVVAEYRADDRPLFLGQLLPVAGNPAFQHLLISKTPLAAGDAQNDPRLRPLRELLQQSRVTSLLMVPLRVGEEVIGGLSLASPSPRSFPAEEINLVWSVAEQTAGMLHRIKLLEDRRLLEEQYYQIQKMEAIGQLTAGIAHDFNNLLTAINGFAELTKMQLRPEDPLTEMVDRILHAGEQAVRLVRQLLAFSRKQIIEPQLLELNDIVTKIDRILQRIIGEHIQMKSSLEPDLGLVKADPAQIEQIIVNLAVNARDAMPQGGQLMLETANVTLDETFAATHLEAQPGEYILLTISDTGHGMNEAVKAHLFEPFFTTKEQGKGTGLGLATVYGIVKQNGGHIWVYSEEGQGTTFKIYLPRVRKAVQPAAQPQVKAEMPYGSETILLAEDETGVRELVQRVLEEQGYTVLVVPNGQAALELVARHSNPIHLLLTDVVMPGLSGRALAEQLQQTRPELKILFMSGYTGEAIAQHGILDPGIFLLQKPFGPLELARKVREVLG